MLVESFAKLLFVFQLQINSSLLAVDCLIYLSWVQVLQNTDFYHFEQTEHYLIVQEDYRRKDDCGFLLMIDDVRRQSFVLSGSGGYVVDGVTWCGYDATDN